MKAPRRDSEPTELSGQSFRIVLRKDEGIGKCKVHDFKESRDSKPFTKPFKSKWLIGIGQRA